MAYDEKMQVYKMVEYEVASLPSTKEVEFALLRVEPLARALQENACCWVTSLGKLLNDTAKESLLQLKNELSVSVYISFPGDCQYGSLITHALHAGPVQRSYQISRYT